MTPTFSFKQFELSDARCGMKIGTDGVLLGAWARLAPGARRVADIGAGCGLIALMMAQRYADVTVDAVEIDPGAAADAADNIAASPWPDRIRTVNASFDTLTGPYDAIVSNPPFFRTGEQAPSEQRARARHSATLAPVSLVRWAANALAPQGTLSVITTAENPDDFEFEAMLVRMYVRRKCMVHTRADRPAMRIMWEFGRTQGPVETSELYIRDSANHYTPEYIELTKDFYLKL